MLTMQRTVPTVMRFALKYSESPIVLMHRFMPQGKPVLNRTEWRGKEPRSCGITNVTSRPYSVGTDEPKIAEIEVTCRPKGCIVYIGETKYDGWTAEVLDKAPDGTLLDGKGNPLPEGQLPVYLRYEVYQDTDFNEIDFGELIGEQYVEAVKHLHFDEVFHNFREAGNFSISLQSAFVAPRRNRPLVRIILSDDPSGVSADNFGNRIVNINALTPRLEDVLFEELLNLVVGFIEGRYSIKNIYSDENVLVQLGGSFIDFTSNSDGRGPRFDCLSKYLPDARLDELATRLMAIFAVDVSVVEGPDGGLLMRRIREKD